MTTYIYEKGDGDKIWRREFGAHPDTRELYFEHGTPVMLSYGLWADIVKSGMEDPGLQDLIEQCIMYYQLGKKNGT